MRLGLTLALAVASLWSAGASAQGLTVTDILGREVTLDGPADKIVLGEGRLIVTLALLHPDPAYLLVGWPSDYQRQDPGTYNFFLEKSPGLANVTIVGEGPENTFSIEQTIAAEPDVVIFAGENSPATEDNELVRQIEAAGIPVVFVDFFRDPIANTVPSIELLGKVLGREAEAGELAAFYQSHLDAISSRLAAANPERPDVFMEAHVGLNQGCCFAPGKGTLGSFVEFAGGHNIGSDVLPGVSGELSLEYIISRDPPIYVGTGGAHLARVNGLVMGPGYDEPTVREALVRMSARPGIADLTAIKSGRVYAVWHLFNDTPLSVIAIEALAKFIHPELFADLDPAATLAEINERFLAVPLRGTYWLALN
jgi:iron complex transport system substrate-binding protein